jgi:hypothetical protein
MMMMIFSETMISGAPHVTSGTPAFYFAGVVIIISSYDRQDPRDNPLPHESAPFFSSIPGYAYSNKPLYPRITK